MGVYIRSRTEGCKLSICPNLERSRCFRVCEFLRVKSDAMALREGLGFQLPLDCCKHEVMIAAYIGTWEISGLCFVDAGLEASGCLNEVCLVVNLSIRGMPKQRVGVESVGKGESVALSEF